ncbi:hypothetical protein H2200_001922 [Cladophialophora chaetospira]|uniref:Amino acid transporter transmembrane domain-containing protein n=1 Tax=Cladophialophora chaetospira TaxID=386627 RepID=A0AA38XMN4_9EURO|nr:hypothetical protein H2200_001922 [Cladophialophora chaetospira]
MTTTYDGEKRIAEITNAPPSVNASLPETKEAVLEAREIFHDEGEGVKFRTVSWQRCTIIFLKIQFAMSILAVPGALATLALADMCGLMWGRIGKELVTFQILVAQVLITAAGIVSCSTAFNALSEHGACTVVFSFVSAVLITLFSSVRTFARLGWLTWFGFATFFIAVFIFVVAVTQQDRPAAAPKTGEFDLGWVAIGHPGFVAGILASANIFLSGSGSQMYLPVISEMKQPRDYRKAAILAGILVGAMYLSFSLVIYRWCGIYLATPAFGSAGTLWKKVSYGIALPGLVIGVGIYQHVAAKLIFVRILRNSRHLQANDMVHWGTWLGSNLLLGVLGFIVSEAVPILNYLLGLAGAVCFAPFSLIFPAMLWMYDFRGYRKGTGLQKAAFGAHIAIVIIGLFMVVGGTYGVAVSIKDAFASGLISKVFDCSDNSGTIS